MGRKGDRRGMRGERWMGIGKGSKEGGEKGCEGRKKGEGSKEEERQEGHEGRKMDGNWEGE